MSQYSLIDLMKNDFCFESLKSAKEDTKKSKKQLDDFSRTYNEKYKQRIQEGTRKKQLLLEQHGLKDNTPEAEQFFKQNNMFYPTVQTPILNMLYFMNEECGVMDQDFESLKKEYEKRYGHLLHEDIDTAILKNDKAKSLERLSYGSAGLNEDYDTGEQVPHMEKYIYQNMDAGTFGKLKKLKALSMSDNPQEAKMAWIKAMDICDRYGLNFEDIPTKYD